MSAFVVVAGGVLVVMAVAAGSTIFTGSTCSTGSITGHEDHEALLTKTSLWREPGPAGIPTARARIASRAAGGLIVKLVYLPNLIVLQI